MAKAGKWWLFSRCEHARSGFRNSVGTFGSGSSMGPFTPNFPAKLPSLKTQHLASAGMLAKV
eukprot:983011-Pelagomonas_calceolata.AAC.6